MSATTAQTLPPQPVQPPADLPGNAPVMAQPKHPCRCSVVGVMHMIGELQNLIGERSDISPEIKAVLAAEIAAKSSNAAQVDLHVVDHANGDSSIHIHVKQVKLG